MLDEFVGNSSRAVVNRGSSLFIRRVADLEDNDNSQQKNGRRSDIKDHFKDAAGQIIEIEMSPKSPFDEAKAV